LAAWPDFRPATLLRRLVEGGVDFVVVGGVAAVALGSVQITRDLDITYAGDAENLERLGRVLVLLGARLRGGADDVPFVPDGRTLRHTRILTLDTADGPLDLLAAPDGAPGYEDLRAHAEMAVVGGVEVHVAALDDLLAMKRAAGRPKDLIAVEELEAIRRLRGA
jgi:predicted nucleotidyltransferase